MFISRQTLLSVALLTFIGGLIHSGEYLEEDMVLHSPLIKKQITPDFYESDYLFNISSPQEQFSIYYPVLAYFIRYSPVSFMRSLYVLHGVYLFGYLLILFIWAKFFTKSYIASLIFCLLVLSRFHIGGTAIQTIEAEIVPRALGTLMALIGLWWRGKSRVAIIFLGLSFLLHPLSGIFGWLLYMIWLFRSKLQKVFASSKSALILCTTMLLLIVGGLTIPTIDTSWLSIIRFRNSYAFADLWSNKTWMHFALLMTPGFLYSFAYRKEMLSKTFAYLTLISVVISLFHFIFVVIHPLEKIIQLQLLRFWLYPAFVSLLCLAVMIDKFGRRNKRAILAATTFLLALLYSRNIHEQLSASWVDTAEWVRSNTSPDCIVLSPFERKGFRVLSERAITGEYKDGALSFYSSEFARQWHERLKSLSNTPDLTDDEVIELQKKYGFHYVVEQRKTSRSFPRVHQNTEFNIYQLSSC